MTSTDLLPAFKTKALVRALRAGCQVVAFVALTLPLLAQAQETNADDSTVVYPADYFNQWRPITAQDMLDRIPGQEDSGPSGGGGGPGGNPSSGGRGLGSGSGGTEIMVNGKRTAGKNNQTRGLLDRITSDQVREIQIIRGTSGDLDVRGSGQVVNVVLFEELDSSSISYQVRGEYIQDDTINAGALASISGQSGGLDYLFSLENGPRYRNSHASESSILGDFSPNDTIVEETTNDNVYNTFSMNLGYALTPNSSIRFNGLYEMQDADGDVDRLTTDLTTTPESYLVERENTPNERDNWEVGGDYELTFGNGDRFKLLGIANENDSDRLRERYQVFPDNTEELNLYLDTGSVTQERILRTSYTTDLFDGQSVEFGIEGAQTILDSKLALGLLEEDGTSDPEVGGLTRQVVTNANSKVEELRFEPFVIHNWTVSPKMSVESTLIFEASEISQSGDVSNERDFEFIKPKVDVRYNITPTFQVRGTIERIVNQLSFSDFVSSNDNSDVDSNTIGGNENLRQQTQWRYSFNSEYRLPNDVGVINTELFYAAHDDVIDWIQVPTTDGSLVSANGNIGDGTEYGANINASIRMGMIGMPNLLVSPGLNVQDSKVTDPFLGIERRFRNYQRGRFTLTFRHDIPEWRVNWGAQYFDRTDGNMFQYDIGDIEFNVGEPRYNLFAEYVDTRGITYRLDLQNLSDNAQCRDRYRFAGAIYDGVLEEIESRCTNTGIELGFFVNGTF